MRVRLAGPRWDGSGGTGGRDGEAAAESVACGSRSALPLSGGSEEAGRSLRARRAGRLDLARASASDRHVVIPRSRQQERSSRRAAGGVSRSAPDQGLRPRQLLALQRRRRPRHGGVPARMMVAIDGDTDEPPSTRPAPAYGTCHKEGGADFMDVGDAERSAVRAIRRLLDIRRCSAATRDDLRPRHGSRRTPTSVACRRRRSRSRCVTGSAAVV